MIGDRRIRRGVIVVAAAVCGLVVLTGSGREPAAAAGSLSPLAAAAAVSPAAAPRAPFGLTTPKALTFAGPVGTTIEVTVWSGDEGTCFELRMSDPGLATSPGKPAFRPDASCRASGNLDPVNEFPATVVGEMWRSHEGRPYFIVLGRAAGATAVRFRFPTSGLTLETPVRDGWFAAGPAYDDFFGGYSETAIGSGGQVIGVQAAPSSVGQPG